MASTKTSLKTTVPNGDEPAPIAGDLLLGVPAIAEFIGLPESRARHWCELGALPCFRMGRYYAARRSELQRALSGVQEGE